MVAAGDLEAATPLDELPESLTGAKISEPSSKRSSCIGLSTEPSCRLGGANPRNYPSSTKVSRYLCTPLPTSYQHFRFISGRARLILKITYRRFRATKSSDNRFLFARGRQTKNRAPGGFAFLWADRLHIRPALDQTGEVIGNRGTRQEFFGITQVISGRKKYRILPTLVTALNIGQRCNFVPE